MLQRIMRRVLVLFTAAMLAVGAWALDLEDAKSRGLVGEREDGYLGVVAGGGEVEALVRDINDRRREKYEEIAARRGTSVDAVELLAGQKAIERTEPGHYIQQAGRWMRK